MYSGESGAQGMQGPVGMKGSKGNRGPIGDTGKIHLSRFVHAFLSIRLTLFCHLMHRITEKR